MTAEDQTAAHTTTTAADQAGGGSTGSAPPGRAASAGRWSVTAVFFLNGLTLSTYVIRLGSLKDKHHLSDGQLGLIGMVFAVAALACMQGVGLLTARVGTRPVLRTSLLVMPVLLALVGLVGGAVELVVVVTILGAVHGTTDAVMNTHAVAIERRLGRPILNGCHAAWSVSAVVASLATAVLERAGISFATHLVAAAAVLMGFTTFTYAGTLLGPAAIGWAAELAGLTWTLAALIPVLCAVALLSRLPGRPQH
jgi:MFS family permease